MKNSCSILRCIPKCISYIMYVEGFFKVTSCSEIRLCLGYPVSEQVISQSDVLTFSQLSLFNLAISEQNKHYSANFPLHIFQAISAVNTITEALGSSEMSVHRASYLRRRDSLTFSSVPLFPSFFLSFLSPLANRENKIQRNISLKF